MRILRDFKDGAEPPGPAESAVLGRAVQAAGGIAEESARGQPPSLGSSSKACKTCSVQEVALLRTSTNATPQPDPELQVKSPPFAAVPYRRPAASIVNPAKGSAPSPCPENV